ncbi:MAG: type IV pili methyl-accepting chemotaxis transducer N-terminal domain-containing protein, partial [Candidatus Eisenbacteria bacterium]|nr:type IV pili methyl-accepting chemotaxis transducer N-terminal domain-containing protein [Candidatus Eisenbacteria bacterium]
MSLFARLSLSGIVALIGLVTVAGLAFYGEHSGKEFATALDIAGRQRMLVEKYSAEILLGDAAVGTGTIDRSHASNRADKTAGLFESSLKALQTGGTATLNPATGEKVEINEFGGDVPSKLSASQAAWTSLKNSAPEAGDEAEKFETFYANSESALAAANGVVVALLDMQGAQKSRLQATLTTAAIICLVLLALSQFDLHRSVVKPVRKVAESLDVSAERTQEATAQVSSMSTNMADASNDQASNLE